MRARTSLVTAVLLMAPLAACGSESDTAAGGAPIVNWYIGNEGWLPDVIKACNEQANGAFFLKSESLPTNPDGQREQLVRRLAAKDDSIDLIGMDVVWTGEFGQAGWIEPFEQGELENVGSEEKVFKGPFESAQYDGKQYGAPLNSNTRLLWYRKSKLGDRPVPETWDELFKTAEELNSPIQETGARAESMVVLFNALVNGAGTTIVEPGDDGEAKVVLEEGATIKALEIMKRLGQAPVAPAGQSNLGEDDNRLAFQSGDSTSAFMINWPFVYPSVVEADPELAKDYGWAPFPSVEKGEPPAAPLGGYNLGISSFTEDREATVAAINCLTSPEQQRTIATKGGQPPVLRELAEDPEIIKDLPFLPLMTEQLDTAVPRPVTPTYNDVSLAVRTVLHPLSSISDTKKEYDELKDLLQKALDSQAVL